jgi:hypothetical protein
VKPSTSAIQIPNALHRNSQFSHNTESAVDNMSSVSGTTLARALIGNTFVLSNDYRLSRNRTGLTRQDSTTLPRNGDHSHRRSKRSPSPSPSTIPPVPPVPADLLPHVRKRTSSAPENFLPVPPPQLTHQSSLGSIVASYGEESRNSAGQPNVSKREETDPQPESNISHTPEAQSLPPSAPGTPPAPPNAPLPIISNNSTASLAHSANTEKTSSSKSSGSGPSISKSNPPSLTLHHRTVSEPKNMPLSATSSTGVDSAFAGFEFASPVRSPLASAAFSEIMSGSSFSLSPYGGESPDKRESKKRQQLVMGMAPSPSTPRGTCGFSILTLVLFV